jgi:galactoside O-acetyltransferase
MFWIELVYSAFVRKRLRQCGYGLRVKLSTVVTGWENIIIGKNFVSMGLLYLYVNDGGYLQIGDNCDANTNVQLGAGTGRLIIGNHVMIAPNVVIRAANHGMAKNGIMKYQPYVSGEIAIQDDVWIGSNAVITPDVTLATGTVVAAGAVVTKSTTPYSIVGGVPARQIGERK